MLIARRYLLGRRRDTRLRLRLRRGKSLISVISAVSVGGVTIGVAALIVVLSVLNGFFEVVRDLLVSYDPHVRIEATSGTGFSNPDSLVALSLEEPHVVSATPFVEGKALLTTAGGGTLNQVVTVRGVEPGALGDDVATAIVAGTFDLTRHEGVSGLAMGSALAARAGLYAGPAGNDGSRLTLLSAPALERALVQYPFGLPAQQTFALRGTFELQPAYDESNVFVNLPAAQGLFGMSGFVSGIDIRVDDLDRAEAVRRNIQRRLDSDRFRVRTWYDLQASLYQVMQLEKWGAGLILALIVVVAAFNIVGALTMTVIEKRRDLGVLRAMGASRSDVQRLFLYEGTLIGVVGVGIGLALGLALCFLQAQFGLVTLGEGGSFVIDAYPISVHLIDVLGVSVIALGLCALAAVYPARRAAAENPADAVADG